MTRYTDEDLDRVERESQTILNEAQGVINRAEDLFESAGLSEGRTISGFLNDLGSSEELEKLRAQHFGDLQNELLEEEKRLSREMRRDAPSPPRRRPHMARV